MAQLRAGSCGLCAGPLGRGFGFADVAAPGPPGPYTEASYPCPARTLRRASRSGSAPSPGRRTPRAPGLIEGVNLHAKTSLGLPIFLVVLAQRRAGEVPRGPEGAHGRVALHQRARDAAESVSDFWDSASSGASSLIARARVSRRINKGSPNFRQ